MNVPEGVNREVENLLSRIGIRDSTFCDEFFVILGFFGKIRIFGKSDPGPPGVDFWERSGLKIGKNVVKVGFTEQTIHFTSIFRTLPPF